MKRVQLILSITFMAVSTFLLADDGNKSDKEKQLSLIDKEVDWRSRPVYLLKVKWPELHDKEKITDGKLLPTRAYVRYEPRFFEIDPETNEKNTLAR